MELIENLDNFSGRFSRWNANTELKNYPWVENIHSPFTPVRRALWWYGLNVDGYQKARNFGTFAINCLAGYRARITQMCFPVTTFLYYGLPEKDGTMCLQMGFDHRVYDGYAAGRLMSERETALNGPIAAEVDALRASESSEDPRFRLPPPAATSAGQAAA